MKSQLLLAFLLFVLAGILGVDRRPAEATAALIVDWAFGRGITDARELMPTPALRLPHDALPRLELRLADGRPLQAPLHGVGTFRCRSRAGVPAPYEIVVPLEAVDGRLRRVQDAPAERRHPSRLSCGLHVLPGHLQAQELFAERGSAVLYAGPAEQPELAASRSVRLELY